MKNFYFKIIFIVCFCHILHGIEFEYYSFPLSTDCFAESLNENTLISSEILSTNPMISVQLFDPNGKKLFSKSNETVCKLSYSAHVGGTYQLCIENLSKQVINYVLKIQTGAFAKDYSELANTKNLKPIEVILKKTEDIVKEIQDTTSVYINKKESIIEGLDSIGTKIMIFSIITIFILMILGFMQANYLKHFFKSKKLL